MGRVDEETELEYVQTILTKEEVRKLLELSGEKSKKNAVRKAVLYFIRSRRRRR